MKKIKKIFSYPLFEEWEKSALLVSSDNIIRLYIDTDDVTGEQYEAILAVTELIVNEINKVADKWHLLVLEAKIRAIKKDIEASIKVGEDEADINVDRKYLKKLETKLSRQKASELKES